MNIKKVMVRVAMFIEEKDADVYNIIVRNKKDKPKPSSSTLNEVATLRFVEAEEKPLYIVKFMGKEEYTTYFLKEAVRITVAYAQEYVDNRAHYNKIRNSI